MSHHLLTDKSDHEERAVDAVRAGRLPQAAGHAAKAAEIGFTLAERSDGLIARRRLEDAVALVEMVEQLRSRAKVAPSVVADGEAGEAGPWRVGTRPDVRLADVAGLDDVKKQLRERVIDPLAHPEVYRRFNAKSGGGVLMYGPPGTGKTFVARAIAGELDAAFFLVEPSQIKDKFVGESEKKLAALFEEARSHERSVVFIDEADGLLSRPSNEKVNLYQSFLQLADGFVQHDGLMLLLAATNRPWLMTDAVLRPGRLGEHIYVGLPGAEARRGIVGYALRDTPVTADIASVARRTEGFSGAEVDEACQKAKRTAIRRQIDSGREEVVTDADFDAALQGMTPLTTPAMLQKFEDWRNRHSQA